MGASWRIGVDQNGRTALVTEGPFGWARNPLLTGMVTAAAGLELIAPTVLSITAVVMLVVGRFVPGLGRISV